MYNKRKQFFKVTPNFNKRTFTIRIQNSYGKTVRKYKSISFNQEEFDSMEFNTQNDWDHFMKTDEYYLIKTYHHNF